MASRPVDHTRYDIRRILKPMVRGGLSSTVVVDKTMYVNVDFSGALVQRAGRLLPRGIGKYETAFMSIDFDIISNKYTLYVQYIDSGQWPQRYQLLVFNERPEWLNKTKRIQYSKQKEQSCPA